MVCAKYISAGRVVETLMDICSTILSTLGSVKEALTILCVINTPLEVV